jgi:NAD-dependent SIR2 family protein deacetylase
MINWPKSLVREVSARRCVFFLGAGVSASAKTSNGSSAKDWDSFIRIAAEQILDSAKKTYVFDLIASKNYLLALQAVMRYMDQGDYQTLLNEHFNNPAYEPSDLHKTIFDLDARIIITTNFDKIYETYCHKQSVEGYKTICYDSASLVDEIRSDTRLIIKAHGSINEINKMIFTKSQYHRAKRQYSNFYEVLKVLFITNTGIFIGCGLNDPDVCLLLEEVEIIGSPAKTHYVLIKQGDQTPVEMDDWKESYNISALEYGPSHENLLADLKTLLDQVNDIRSLCHE